VSARAGLRALPTGGWGLPASLVTGVLGALTFDTLPPAWLVYGIAAVAAMALGLSRFRLAAAMLLAFCWSIHNFHLRLESQLDPGLAGQIVQLKGVISAIPTESSDFTRFLFRPDKEFRSAGLPPTLLVHWYMDWPELSVGEYWQLELKVKPPWGPVNFQGADKERWLFASGIGGLGTVRTGHRLASTDDSRFPVDSLREKVLDSISEQVVDERERGVIQALATADRSGLAANDRRLLTVTGTSHLLAISGLHVGLAAAGGMWLSRILLWFLPLLKTGNAMLLVSITGGLFSACSYAALAGLGTPTLRAVLMLFTGMTAVLLCRAIHPFRAWMISLAIILLIDPFAPMGAGLWYTFLAVAALLFVFRPRTGRLNWWKTILMAQSGVVLVLLPVSAGWFYSFSPTGFLANLMAIPWVSFLVVPPVLAGLTVLPFSVTLAGAFWSAASLASKVLFLYLESIDRIQGELSTMAPPSALQVALALVGAFVLLLPRGITPRWLGLFLILPLFFPPGERTQAGTLEVEVLDVGQGTAVLVSSGGQSLLYDSGPGDGNERNLVAGVIAPALARLGTRAPDHVVISHGDLDHAGGLQSLLRLYPGAEYRANLGGSSHSLDECRTPLSWSGSGVTFDTLHPSPGLPYLGNDSSCVISVKTGGRRLLLSGDISKSIENRLIMQGLQGHQVLLVPHHGSKSSSSIAFIKMLRPEVAIATASLGNRFGFPRPEVRARYEALDSRFWSTGECGALRLLLHPDGKLEASSARRERKRIWRWTAAVNCP
jgi:competence protein ComEC